MNDLTRPLGKKLPKKIRRKPPVSLATLSLAVGLIVGLAAIGFIFFDRFYPGQALNSTQNVSSQPGNQTVNQSAGQAVDFNNDVPLRNSEIGKEAINAEPPGAVASLQELKPSGTISGPQVRPLPSPRKIGQEQGTSHLPDPALTERGATGVIPKIAEDGRRAMDVYAREPDTAGNFGVARIVIIIGGMGISQTSSQQAIKDLPPSVTLAFAPYGNSLDRWMQASRKKGHELLLQIPMEPLGQINPGAHTLKTGASFEENIADLHWSMSRITNYVGVMNYLGGKLSSDINTLKPIFDELARRGLLYVDDGSAGNSRAAAVATAYLLPFAKAQIQIDAIRTRREITKNLEKLAEQAKRTGLAIGVANAFPETIELIAKFAKKAPGAGIEITPVSAIVSDPKIKG